MHKSSTALRPRPLVPKQVAEIDKLQQCVGNSAPGVPGLFSQPCIARECRAGFVVGCQDNLDEDYSMSVFEPRITSRSRQEIALREMQARREVLLHDIIEAWPVMI
jgi:hypothetical protein